jgi:hypothetical protein
MSPTFAGRRSLERKTDACPVTFLIWAIGEVSAAQGTPAVAINNAAANHSARPKFFLPANFFLSVDQGLLDTRVRQAAGSKMSNFW